MTDSTTTGGTRLFRFGVVAPLTTDLPTWRDRVRRIADAGYSTLLMPDVPQWQPAPGPTLALAAALANLRVGTWVYASPRTGTARGPTERAVARVRETVGALGDLDGPTLHTPVVMEEIGFSYFVFGADFAAALAPVVAELA